MNSVSSIPGWFDWHDLYRRMVRVAPDNAQFVEVGVWMGKSFCFLLNEARNTNKNIMFHAVDTFTGGETEQDEVIRRLGGSDKLLSQFVTNVRKQRYRNVKIHQKPSVEAATSFADESLYFVFIDAAHDYKSVKDDIEAWTKKVIPGGIIAGHDYNSHVGVKKAVKESFKDFTVEGNCWVKRIPQTIDHLDMIE
jgi:hypothetical protein